MTDLAFSDRAENRFVSMGLELEDRMGMLEGEFGFV
jgi:ACT domain-containing protein